MAQTCMLAHLVQWRCCQTSSGRKCLATHILYYQDEAMRNPGVSANCCSRSGAIQNSMQEQFASLWCVHKITASPLHQHEKPQVCKI